MFVLIATPFSGSASVTFGIPAAEPDVRDMFQRRALGDFREILLLTTLPAETPRILEHLIRRAPADEWQSLVFHP
jgi:hypothetical protein